MTTTAAPVTIHPFEAAGLGRYPFRFLGVASWSRPAGSGGFSEAERAQRANAETSQSLRAWGVDPGATGICQACFHEITANYVIRSADGKVSVVGCDCILKIAAGIQNHEGGGMPRLTKTILHYWRDKKEFRLVQFEREVRSPLGPKRPGDLAVEEYSELHRCWDEQFAVDVAGELLRALATAVSERPSSNRARISFVEEASVGCTPTLAAWVEFSL